MKLETFAIVTTVLAALPATLALFNLALYRRAPRDGKPGASVSVLIPARNEEGSIRSCVESVLASRGIDFEVIVMDDSSEDSTSEIVRAIAERDPRVRLETAPQLPPAWCGKPHACDALARVARNKVLLFIDADVTVTPDGIRRMLLALDRTGADLISGVPRQQTATIAERLIVPLIHFVLLGYLPLLGMRLSSRPAFAAGCGQLVMTRNEAYRRVGGHAAIRASRHDGLALPRAYRRAGYVTDLFDPTDVAACRMYRGVREVWEGFAKNATEGMASPRAILPWTLLLVGGHVLPVAVLLAAIALGASNATKIAAIGVVLPIAVRVLMAKRLRQPLLSALLHPLGMLLLVAIQWYALIVQISGHHIAWKGRPQVTSLIFLLAAAVSTVSTGPAELTIVVDGLRSDEGSVAFALYGSAETFDGRSGAVRSAFLPIENGSVRWTFSGLPHGEYAAMMYHDENGNGKIDERKVGPPKEPYGFSNDARAPFGPPSYKEARFFIDENQVEIRVRVH